MEPSYSGSVIDNVGYMNDWYERNKRPEFHDVNSITLAELIDGGVFDWSYPVIDWKKQSFDDEQYERVCTQFVERFYWREISIVPPLQWLQRLGHKMKNELMPKYRPLYDKVTNGIDWFADKDEFGKLRHIESGFPETMLSGSEAYASSGRDEEFETITDGSTIDKYNQFVEEFKSIDQALLDELECLFSGLWSSNVNAW